MKIRNDISLYIHIPFCVQKCKYCDFLSFSSLEEDRNSYIQELKKELQWKSQWASGASVISVFFGGGTPSILRVEQMEELLSLIKEYYTLTEDVEITMEANPGTLTVETLLQYQRIGINRLSIGLQSGDDQELEMLGRIHTWEQFERNYRDARKVGFENINVDLMSALPGQTIESYQKTLKKVVRLDPEHISAYSLIVEEGTPLYEDEILLEKLPGEELDRQMYQMTKEFLHAHGYERYEISNYAKPGYECRHNSVYWTGGEYLGFGLGASSFFKGKRFHNEETLFKYRFDGTPQDVEVLTKEDKMGEFMFLGLRMTKGVNVEDFYQKFGHTMEEIYGQVIRKHEKEGLLICENGIVKLTDRGLDVSNYIFCDFLIE
ncbi:MAG: radical SAM family heme chaperone HemW [Anaerostipes sp.]|uniref:radical SAM family heme chaperone HemW n=1 Tax=Anaerostipes sp. 992a TaxID=1261637 RepID=UPI000951C55B|nr:radical SAM family heme chaperone HemW [Anaerostipes sp. 992a]MCI5951752.1 radical SAM family heme chaperone HemW [Anaerostipes sp.]OLR62073.1 coproporphyrinogen III oxidase [Anaerostipes sp. 992a]